MGKSGISFIVCCYNSASVIQTTIAAINNQENGGILYELLLVDNNCSDQTVAIAQSAWQRPDISMRVLKEEKPGLSYARIKGVEQASYDIICFIDDDNIIEEKWIVKVARLFNEHPNVGIIGSNNKPLVKSAPYWFEQFQAAYACGEQNAMSGYISGKRKYVFGAGLSIRKHIIQDIYGSDLPVFLSDRKGKMLASGGDSEICMRVILMGYKIWYEKALHLFHRILPERLEWKYLRRLNVGFGYSAVILEMYSTMIDNGKPISRRSALKSLIKRFVQRSVRVLQNFFLGGGQVRQDEIKFYFLLGEVWAFKDSYRNYQDIANQIYRHFNNRKS